MADGSKSFNNKIYVYAEELEHYITKKRGTTATKIF